MTTSTPIAPVSVSAAAVNADAANLSDHEQQSLIAMVVTLSDDQLHQLADLVAARLLDATDRPGMSTDTHNDDDNTRRLVTADVVARELGVARSYVYRHADELGVTRLPGQDRPRLRFDLETARAATACSSSKHSQPQNGSSKPRPARGSCPPARTHHPAEGIHR